MENYSVISYTAKKTAYQQIYSLNVSCIFLRWHYPNQVKGQDISCLLSAQIHELPIYECNYKLNDRIMQRIYFCFLCYFHYLNQENPCKTIVGHNCHQIVYCGDKWAWCNSSILSLATIMSIISLTKIGLSTLYLPIYWLTFAGLSSLKARIVVEIM